MLDLISSNFLYNFFVLQPFDDENHFIHKYFLPHQYAIIIPTFGLVTLFCFLVVFIGVLMMKRRSHNKSASLLYDEDFLLEKWKPVEV